jgi:hypothetical protein
LELGIGHGEAVAALEGLDHAAEVLADELVDEGGAREGLVEIDIFGAGDFVDEVSAAFEGERLGEDERVVTVEEDGGDLGRLAGERRGDRKLAEGEKPCPF